MGFQVSNILKTILPPDGPAEVGGLESQALLRVLVEKVSFLFLFMLKYYKSHGNRLEKPWKKN